MVSLLNHIVFLVFFLTKTNGFLTRWKITWIDRNVRKIVWKHLLSHTRVTKALNSPKKRPQMVLIGKFSQPYSQYSVWAWASGGAVHPLFLHHLSDQCPGCPQTRLMIILATSITSYMTSNYWYTRSHFQCSNHTLHNWYLLPVLLSPVPYLVSTEVPYCHPLCNVDNRFTMVN